MIGRRTSPPLPVESSRRPDGAGVGASGRKRGRRHRMGPLSAARSRAAEEPASGAGAGLGDGAAATATVHVRVLAAPSPSSSAGERQPLDQRPAPPLSGWVRGGDHQLVVVSESTRPLGDGRAAGQS